MNKEAFWAAIEAHVTFDENGWPEVGDLTSHLASMSPQEIVSWSEHFESAFVESYSWALWGAAYLICGGCSDDGFDYFRGALIALGRETYQKAVSDPDSLAGVLEDEISCEEMLYVGATAYEQVTEGGELPEHSVARPELGEGWDFDDEDEMRSRYPRLAAKFL